MESKDEKNRMLVGANYWPSAKGVYWWKEFEIATLKRDFSLAAEYRFDLLRIFLLWDAITG